MTAYELNREQLEELKQRLIMERNDRRGYGTSMNELANADIIVSDEEVYQEYADYDFVDEDFFVSEEQEPEYEEYSFGVNLSGTPEYIAEQLRLIASDIKNGSYGGLAGGYGASWGLDRI